MNESPAADYNLRILAPIAGYFREKYDEGTLAEVCADAGIAPSEFDKPVRWIAHDQFERILTATREKLGSDELFMEACSYRMAESYGPLRYLAWATTPALVYVAAEKASRFFTTVGKFELTQQSGNFARLRYTSTRPESRLICLSRQAQSTKAPTLWKLPPATCREQKCIARGDDCCEYEFHWFNKGRWLPAILGFAVGLGVFGLAWKLPHVPLTVLGWALPFLGATIAHIFELARTQRANEATQHEITLALRSVINDDAEARLELLELHQRQRDWSSILEEEVAERHRALQQMATQFSLDEQARATAIRGVSHDIRTPLAIFATAIDYVSEQISQLGPDGNDVLGELIESKNRMEKMLFGLSLIAKRDLVGLLPERFDVAPLTERLRRRLRALVHGRDIRASVFGSREVPRAIHIDPLLFDRVLDNMLTNAVKYTDRGSIIVELDGIPGFLVIKISDTGRGIEEEALRQIFRPGGSDANHRGRDSWGVGLSVVVDLLGQIGGKLDVMSKVGQGTTFWVHFPVSVESSTMMTVDRAERPLESAEARLSRVVNIRRTAG